MTSELRIGVGDWGWEIGNPKKVGALGVLARETPKEVLTQRRKDGKKAGLGLQES